MLSAILNFIANLFCPPPPPPPVHEPPRPPYQVSQPHKPPRPPRPPQKPPHKPLYQDQNQINQANNYYVNLRAKANEEGDAMAICFAQSHKAYSCGDKVEAKTLSNKGREHQRRMETLHKEASDWIFTENNKDSKPGEIDLHGLYVKEAIAHTDRAIEQAKRRGDTEIRLIVGKGLHSKGHAAKIKPAIEELMQKHQLRAVLDSRNAGVLLVQINSGQERGFGSDEITRRIEREDAGCLVM